MPRTGSLDQQPNTLEPLQERTLLLRLLFLTIRFGKRSCGTTRRPGRFLIWMCSISIQDHSNFRDREVKIGCRSTPWKICLVLPVRVRVALVLPALARLAQARPVPVLPALVRVARSAQVLVARPVPVRLARVRVRAVERAALVLSALAPVRAVEQVAIPVLVRLALVRAVLQAVKVAFRVQVAFPLVAFRVRVDCPHNHRVSSHGLGMPQARGDSLGVFI